MEATGSGTRPWTGTTREGSRPQADGRRRSNKGHTGGRVVLLFRLILLLDSREVGLRGWQLVARRLVPGLTRLGGCRIVLLRHRKRVRGRLRGAPTHDRQRHEARNKTIDPYHGALHPARTVL